MACLLVPAAAMAMTLPNFASFRTWATSQAMAAAETLVLNLNDTTEAVFPAVCAALKRVYA